MNDFKDDIYVFVDQLNEQWNRYYPQSLGDWSRIHLVQFDLDEVGTKAQLEQRRRTYESSLEPLWRTYRDALWTKQNDLMETFRSTLAEEFLPTIPQVISDRVYYRAWEEGHHAGFRNVVNVYRDIADFVKNLLKDYIVLQRSIDQELLLKG